MSDDLISREALRSRMYHEAFEVDNGMQRWDSGLWIRYKIFENVIEEAPAVQPERNAMTCYGYRIEHLAFIASVMAKKGITPEQALDMMTNIALMRDLIFEEQMQSIQQTIEDMLKGIKGDEP